MDDLADRIILTINILSDDLMGTSVKNDYTDFRKKLALIGDLACDLNDELRRRSVEASKTMNKKK